MFLRLEPAFAETFLQAIRWLGNEELKEAWNYFCFEVFIFFFMSGHVWALSHIAFVAMAFGAERGMSFGPV